MLFKCVVTTGVLGFALASASPSLVGQRQASLDAIRRHAEVHPQTLERCGPVNWDVKTDVIAFPVERADRVYVQEGYQGRAYQIRRGVARLVWCGAHPQVGEQASKLGGNVERALGIPLRTASGVLPVERGGMDIFTGFAGVVTTSRMNAAGKLVCSKRRFDGREFRSGFQFDARDTCP
ncbi:hypothetical protein V3W47_06040 [Deinococcus sp. YIM 134068]|uniref:hypothetical protein n=1 Tax=Deinococcus lichenicola TaxID=3118910 RepID=UPI002F949B00